MQTVRPAAVRIRSRAAALIMYCVLYEHDCLLHDMGLRLHDLSNVVLRRMLEDAPGIAIYQAGLTAEQHGGLLWQKSCSDVSCLWPNGVHHDGKHACVAECWGVLGMHADGLR